MNVPDERGLKRGLGLDQQVPLMRREMNVPDERGLKQVLADPRGHSHERRDEQMNVLDERD